MLAVCCMREKEVETQGFAGAAETVQFERLILIPVMKFITQGPTSYGLRAILELLPVLLVCLFFNFMAHKLSCF